jgi:hypothetical protein
MFSDTALNQFYNGYKVSGGTLDTVDQFYEYIGKIKGGISNFTQFLEPALETYLESNSILDVQKLYYGLGENSKGKLPTRIELQQFIQILADDIDPSKPSNFLKYIFSGAVTGVKEVANTATKVVQVAGDAGISAVNLVSGTGKYIPYILIFGAGLYLFFKYKQKI